MILGGASSYLCQGSVVPSVWLGEYSLGDTTTVTALFVIIIVVIIIITNQYVTGLMIT